MLIPRSTLAIALLAAGCSGTSFVGTVTDVSEQPLEGATITVVGTQCQTTVDGDGSFDLPCKPGEHRVAIAQRGFISKEIEVSAQEATEYDLGKHILIRIPEGEGLFVFQGSKYAPMAPSQLQRKLDKGQSKAFCLHRESATPNKQNAGRIPLFDKGYDDWRAWKLDEQGCAYRSEREGHKWQETYAERVSTTERKLEQDKSVVLLEAPAGEYFIADWRNGWFVEDEDPDLPPGDKRYSGFYIVAE